MRINSVEFITSAVKSFEYPKATLPEIAFAGRSNVGKSALINTMVNRKNIARTSVTPGRTQTINFFLVNGRIYFVDLPGYGFANVPREVRAQWKPMVEDYLRHRSTLKLVVLLLDIRRQPSTDDASLMRWFETFDIPFLVILTKADKLSRSKCSAQEKLIKNFFMLDEGELVRFSAVTREGREDILTRIMKCVQERIVLTNE